MDRIRFRLGFSMAMLSLLFLLPGRPAFADLRRVDAHTSGVVASGVKVVKTDTDRAHAGFVVGVKDSDNRLKLIGFTATRDGVQRVADARTGGANPGDGFALAATSGMVVSLCPRHDARFTLISWDATSIKPIGTKRAIKRLQTYTGGRAGLRMDLAYMHTRGQYHRFAVLLSDADKKVKVIIFDVDRKTGAFHRRGDAVGGGVVAVHSLETVYVNVVDESDPARVASAVLTNDGLWVRVWLVDRDGNVAMGGSIGGGRVASRVELGRVDKNYFLGSFAQSDLKPKVVAFTMSGDGKQLTRGAQQVYNEGRPNYMKWRELAACTYGGTEHFLAMQDRSEELKLVRILTLGSQKIVFEGANTESGATHSLDCTLVGGYIIAAVRTAESQNLKVIQFVR